MFREPENGTGVDGLCFVTNRLTIQVCAIGRSKISDPYLAVLSPEHSVLTTYVLVGKDDVDLRRPADQNPVSSHLDHVRPDETRPWNGWTRFYL